MAGGFRRRKRPARSCCRRAGVFTTMRPPAEIGVSRKHYSFSENSMHLNAAPHRNNVGNAFRVNVDSVTTVLNAGETSRNFKKVPFHSLVDAIRTQSENSNKRLDYLSAPPLSGLYKSAAATFIPLAGERHGARRPCARQTESRPPPSGRIAQLPQVETRPESFARLARGSFFGRTVAILEVPAPKEADRNLQPPPVRIFINKFRTPAAGVILTNAGRAAGSMHFGKK